MNEWHILAYSIAVKLSKTHVFPRHVLEYYFWEVLLHLFRPCFCFQIASVQRDYIYIPSVDDLPFPGAVTTHSPA